MPESIPERVARIARDHNISRKEARRIAFVESRIEAMRLAVAEDSRTTKQACPNASSEEEK